MLLLNFIFKKLDTRLDNFWNSYYTATNKLNNDNYLSKEVSELRNVWKNTSKIYVNYNQKTESTVGWFKSFVPFSSEFHLRRQLTDNLKKTDDILSKAQYNNKKCLYRLSLMETSRKKAPESKNINKSNSGAATLKNSSQQNSWFRLFNNKQQNQDVEYYVRFKNNLS